MFSKLQLQLQSLMETLNSTEPHYIRCVKPNNALRPAIFENANIIQQLRCGVSIVWLQFYSLVVIHYLIRQICNTQLPCFMKPTVLVTLFFFFCVFVFRFQGVLEAIRISCAGYPTRRTFYEFLHRFGVLAPDVLDGKQVMYFFSFPVI